VEEDGKGWVRGKEVGGKEARLAIIFISRYLWVDCPRCDT